MAKKKRDPRGRKARAGEASSNVTVRLASSEREAYQAAADAAGITLAGWIRQACAAHVGPRK
jgi:hypothetical protein